MPSSKNKIGHFKSNWMNDHQALQAVPNVEFKCIFSAMLHFDRVTWPPKVTLGRAAG